MRVWNRQVEHIVKIFVYCRAYLNQQNQLKKNEVEKHRPTYVVIDGKDPLHTILIGAQKYNNLIMTTLVNVVGCFPKDHKVISLEAMEADHIKNTRVKSPKVSVIFYYLENK